VIHKIARPSASFGATVGYVLNPDKGGLIDTNLLAESEREELTNELKEVAAQREGVEKPVFHASLRVAPGEELSNTEWRVVAREYMDEMGYREAPYLVARHRNIDDGDHIHIVASRVDMHGQRLASSKERERGMVVVRRLEQERGLETPRAARGKESARARGANRDGTRAGLADEVRGRVREALRSRPEIGELTAKLGEEGVELELVGGKAGEVIGVRYRCEGRGFAGSELGKDLAWGGLKELVSDGRVARVEERGRAWGPWSSAAVDELLRVTEKGYRIVGLEAWRVAEARAGLSVLGGRALEGVADVRSVLGAKERESVELWRAMTTEAARREERGEWGARTEESVPRGDSRTGEAVAELYVQAASIDGASGEQIAQRLSTAGYSVGVGREGDAAVVTLRDGEGEYRMGKLRGAQEVEAAIVSGWREKGREAREEEGRAPGGQVAAGLSHEKARGVEGEGARAPGGQVAAGLSHEKAREAVENRMMGLSHEKGVFGSREVAWRGGELPAGRSVEVAAVNAREQAFEARGVAREGGREWIRAAVARGVHPSRVVEGVARGAARRSGHVLVRSAVEAVGVPYGAVANARQLGREGLRAAALVGRVLAGRMGIERAAQLMVSTSIVATIKLGLIVGGAMVARQVKGLVLGDGRER